MGRELVSAHLYRKVNISLITMVLPRYVAPFYIIREFMCNWRMIIINKKCKDEKYNVPLWQKTNLTLEETAAYSGIGINKIRVISDGENCPFVLWIGNKRLIKRRLFDEYIERQYSI